jgi:2'-5' RNA ligase
VGDGPSTARLFVAVDLDQAARRVVTGAAVQIAERLGAVDGIRVSWVRPRNLHLTVRFLGEVGRETRGRLQTSLARRWALAPFELALAPAGVFPVFGAPRVVWVGVRDCGGAFERLTPELDARLAAAGATVSDDAMHFTPHVTIGRVRRAPNRGRDIREAAAAVSVEPERWRVTDVTLYESRPTDGPPTYVARAAGPLAAGTASA